MSLRYAASALAVASLATAQCSGSATTTIGSMATPFGTCQTYSGAVALATDAPSTIDLGPVQEIDGAFVADGGNMTQSITASSLANITGRFELNNLPNLFRIDMESLRGVGRRNQGGIFWQGLPNLQMVNFGAGLDSAGSIDIQNTQIQDISNLNVKQANAINIANNPSLTAVSWATTNCTNLTITSNGQSTSGANITLNSLLGVGTFTVGNASALSIPALESCDGLFSVNAGTLESVMAPNLTQAAGIAVANGIDLTNVSFPALTEVTGGALRLVNNDKLGGDLIFPQLTQIRGSLNITGAFDSVQMPQLNTIQGTSYLYSSGDISSTCRQFGKGGSYAGSKIRGGVTCTGRQMSSPGSVGSGTNTGADGSESSGSAVTNFIAQPASLFGATGLFAAMLGLM